MNALFEDSVTNEDPNTLAKLVRLSSVEPNKHQPRKDFDPVSLEQLADSIRQYGVIQPLLVQEIGLDTYMIIAGERRWRASRMAGIEEIPVIIKTVTPNELMEISLIENLQREDLNSIEEALGYKELSDKYNFTQEEIASKVGKSRPSISNSLRLLNLPHKVLDMLKCNDISAGHARCLLALPQDLIEKYADIVVAKSLSVREIERIVNEIINANPKNAHPIKIRDSYYDEVELSLKEVLGNRVKVITTKNKGKIEIEFLNKEQLKGIIERLEQHLQD